ncbi:MAG: hypothetical protein JWQ11_2753, partial [Rhizobacter sp.]|nr:hypothetical protein [Rhizobacter sp.]
MYSALGEPRMPLPGELEAYLQLFGVVQLIVGEDTALHTWKVMSQRTVDDVLRRFVTLDITPVRPTPMHRWPWHPIYISYIDALINGDSVTVESRAASLGIVAGVPPGSPWLSHGPLPSTWPARDGRHR